MARGDEEQGVAGGHVPAGAWRSLSLRVASSLALTLAIALPRAQAQDFGGGPPAGGAVGGGAAAPAGGATEGGATLGLPAAGGGQPAGPAREWTVIPSVGMTETMTDNVRSVSTNRQSDLISQITPSIYLKGDTPRLQSSLSYSPSVIEHLTATDQNTVNQNLAGSGTLSVVPNLLFFDAHAAITNLDRAGGYGFGNQTQIPTTLSTQTTAYSGSPYVRLHFGDTGDAEIRYTFGQTIFNGNTGPVAGPVVGTTTGGISNSTQNGGVASFTTGEALARLKLTTTLNYNDFSGGPTSSSRNESFDTSAQYNVSGPYIATGDAGYERIKNSQTGAQTGAQTSPFNSNGLRWSLGGRYQPREDRQFSLSYGKSQGQTGLTGNVSYALTPLTLLTGSYSHQTTTQQQQILQALAGITAQAPGTVDPTTGLPIPGTAINPITGLPIGLFNPNLALQDTVERVKTLNLGLHFQASERNNYTLSLNRVAAETATAGSFAQITTGGAVSWGHIISESTTSSFSAAYSVTSTQALTTTTSTSGSVFTLTAALNYAISDTLAASANYSLARQTSGGTGSVLVNLAVFTLTKSF